MRIIEVKNLGRVYRKGGRDEISALCDINLSVNKGDWVVITGPSGSGKSTLLSAMAALDRPTSGEIHIDGLDICSASDNELALYRKNKIGVVFQEYQLLDSLTAWENVAMPLIVSNNNRLKRKKRAETLLTMVGLKERANHYPLELSGGERQRVAIARAMISDPGIIFADEPTSNIDKKAALMIIKLLTDLRNTGSTIVSISHDLEFIRHADQIIKLSNGRTVYDS